MGADDSFDPKKLPPLATGAAGALAALFSGCRLQPRPYQSRIVDTALQMFAGRAQRHGRVLPAASSVLIESPTGSGKTVLGLAIAALIQRATGARVGWVAMRRNLSTVKPLKQAANAVP